MLEVGIDVAPEYGDHIDEALLQRAVATAIEVARRDGADVLTDLHEIAVSIRVTGDDEMQVLNRDFRGVDRTTDVLSFSFVAEQSGPPVSAPDEWPTELGEIILSFPYAERQSTDLGHDVPTELAWLTIHGTLQLLGYSHAGDAEAEHMEALEREALHSLGVTVD